MANYNNPADTAMEDRLNLNLTTSQGVKPLYQDVLDRHLLERATPMLVHHQFGQKVKIQKGKGKTITFQQLSPLPLAKVPLIEGITPKGSAINVHQKTAVCEQFGDYIATSDQFEMFTPDPPPVVLKLNQILANQAAETMDSLTADVLSSGTNVQYVNGKLSRSTLIDTDILTVEEIRKAVRTLKTNKAKPFKDGSYVCIIHPDITHDIMSDPDWKDVKTYSDPKDIYNGEIGKLYGVRFVESTEAVVFRGADLVADRLETMQIAGIDSTRKIVNVAEEIFSGDCAGLASREVLIYGKQYTISSAAAGNNGSAKLTLATALDDIVDVDMTIYPGEGASHNMPVYSTLVLGADAYGVSDPKGNLENITKSLGSGGSADPLNQRATIGWKALHVAKILIDEYMVRIESVSSRYKDLYEE